MPVKVSVERRSIWAELVAERHIRSIIIIASALASILWMKSSLVVVPLPAASIGAAMGVAVLAVGAVATPKMRGLPVVAVVESG